MNLRTVFLPFGLSALLPLLACTASTAPGPDGHTSESDTSPPDPSTCAASLADYCGSHSCLTTWDAADEVCMSNSDPSVQSSMACGSFFAFSQGDTTSYYETSTSGLLAIVDAKAGCLAGPSDFAVPAAASCPLVVCGMETCGGPPPGVTP